MKAGRMGPQSTQESLDTPISVLSGNTGAHWGRMGPCCLVLISPHYLWSFCVCFYLILFILELTS